MRVFGNACIQCLQTILQDLYYAFKKFSITTCTTSDRNRNKNTIHYIQGKPTDYGIKNLLLIQEPTKFGGLPSSEKIFRIFSRYVVCGAYG